MNDLREFLANHSALLVAIVALFISLRANYIAQQAHKLNLRSKLDADRILLFEKKRELLGEVDRQHTRMATLSMVTAQKILLFREHPELHESMPAEFDRLKSNLESIQTLSSGYDEQRKGIETIDVGADIAKQDELLANIRRLTIHLEKDITHEQSTLPELQAKVGSHLIDRARR